MNFWQEKLKIGPFLFPRFIGGPLDGITDSPFRRLVRDFSTDELLYTEMRHVACIAHDTGKVRALDFLPIERPLSYQIAANSTNFIAKAIERILGAGVDIIDLNIGCPARNVVCSGSGSALMADHPRLKTILETIRACAPNTPFTVKIRSGFKVANAVDTARLIQDCGADALAIHPRLQTQAFEGRPDYGYAAEVKKAVSIPVILSGNVINWKTAELAYEQTGADGFLIGRGIWSKPWKLKELDELSRGNQFSVSRTMILTYALKHLDYLIDYYGVRGLYHFRKHIPFYLRGIPSASAARAVLVQESCFTKLKDGLVHALSEE